MLYPAHHALDFDSLKVTSPELGSINTTLIKNLARNSERLFLLWKR